MMFKIVQTTEKGLKTLTIVPSTWENKGELAWPKHNADKLVLKPVSVPEESWFRMKCKLKRNHLINYGVAEEELDRMLEQEDTEQEENFEKQRQKKTRISYPQQNISSNNFNELAASCLVRNEEALVGTTMTTVFEEPKILPEVLETNEDYQIEFVDDRELILNTETISPTEDPHQLHEKLNLIITNQNTIVQNQNLIVQQLENLASTERQLKIIEQLSKLETMTDALATTSTMRNCTCRSTAANSNTCEVVGFQRIETLEDLEKLEKKLANEDEMKNHIKNLTYVCGKKGSGNGINNSYLLVDSIFSRNFMTLCSWAGGGRNNVEKIPFKIYKNIMNMFFTIVKLSDEDFTVQQCDDFFKNVIRNSKKRNETNMKRTSKIKRRPNNLHYKVKRNNDETLDNHQTHGDPEEEQRRSPVTEEEITDQEIRDDENGERDSDGGRE